ncbi:hypothetical protein H072_5030 [Dactylellina haptotyla CBS 200.50]|uniref:Uncharacterized protein n=1 Tax=Dactylellina haptotyla (strain CBS 200.50) TaxID=1284197 RepID=S8AIW2_DACHA|nr:hypothetical protein H072_5030 [Dactylellina haptotyla CBS 200.50]
MAISRAKRTKLRIYKFIACFLWKVKYPVKCMKGLVRRVVEFEEERERDRLLNATRYGRYLLHRCVIENDDEFFQSKGAELSFLVTLTYKEYLLMKRYIEFLSTGGGMGTQGENDKMDSFIIAAMGLDDARYWLSSVSAREPWDEEVRKHHYATLCEKYGELIRRMEESHSDVPDRQSSEMIETFRGYPLQIGIPRHRRAATRDDGLNQRLQR